MTPIEKTDDMVTVHVSFSSKEYPNGGTSRFAVLQVPKALREKMQPATYKDVEQYVLELLQKGNPGKKFEITVLEFVSHTEKEKEKPRTYLYSLGVYGPEFERYIVCTSFSGKDKDRIGVFRVTGRYYAAQNATLFEVPQPDGGSHTYQEGETYADFALAQRQYTIEAIAAIQEYTDRVGKLLAGFKVGA